MTSCLRYELDQEQLAALNPKFSFSKLRKVRKNRPAPTRSIRDSPT